MWVKVGYTQFLRSEVEGKTVEELQRDFHDQRIEVIEALHAEVNPPEEKKSPKEGTKKK